jgi:hypothetical protein
MLVYGVTSFENNNDNCRKMTMMTLTAQFLDFRLNDRIFGSDGSRELRLLTPV